jgi:hypothetical protein
MLMLRCKLASPQLLMHLHRELQADGAEAREAASSLMHLKREMQGFVIAEDGVMSS